MTMPWNGKLTTQGRAGGAVFVHILGLATIAAVASSCSPMRAQPLSDTGDAAISTAEAGDTQYAPPVRELDPALAEQIRDEAAEVYKDQIETNTLGDVYVTMSYIDSSGRERLLSLSTTLPPGNEEPIDPDLFRIPTGPKDYTTGFGDAIAIYTGSPATQRSCGSSGGTRYCNF